MVSPSFAQNILRCPFCETPIGACEEVRTKFGNVFEGGKCECGAAYVFERSGHNLGDAYVDLLAYACDGDWDRAFNLVPDEDYEVLELAYDSRRNKFSSSRGRRTATYLFAKVKDKNK